VLFTPATIAGVYVIDIEPIVDERGFFARAWCREDFERHGLVAEFAQANIAHSTLRGTLRGLHYVQPPLVEAKLVRCTQGAAFVVVADIRLGSKTRGQWCSVELTAENHCLLYVPPGCAQGYQTLAAETEMLYQMSSPFVPGSTRGIRYDDPAFGICWPLPISCISDADRSWPLLSAANDSRVNLPTTAGAAP
jgi:dTDP-4-dehydrorhamnose 3,5-epimerase